MKEEHAVNQGSSTAWLAREARTSECAPSHVDRRRAAQWAFELAALSWPLSGKLVLVGPEPADDL